MQKPSLLSTWQPRTRLTRRPPCAHALLGNSSWCVPRKAASERPAYAAVADPPPAKALTLQVATQRASLATLASSEDWKKPYLLSKMNGCAQAVNKANQRAQHSTGCVAAGGKVVHAKQRESLLPCPPCRFSSIFCWVSK